LSCIGYAIVTDLVDERTLEDVAAAMYRVRKEIIADIGSERLEAAGEIGVLRLMMKYDPSFLRFLEMPEILAIVDNTVSSTAVLHLQNGFILPSYPETATPEVFQNCFHMDFRRLMNGYLASVNVLVNISGFSKNAGGTFVVPGSHQKTEGFDTDYMERAAVAVECPPGSMIVFDSTLWHAAGKNVSGRDRLAINHQFTRSFFKQQIDYVRALDSEVIKSQSPRTQQLLGWYTRVCTSLDEYYQPAERRLYRAGQG
jgi:ectoine hydroxylase-related dioxygenase (phytanoyl-CoA dioxygenase family)